MSENPTEETPQSGSPASSPPNPEALMQQFVALLSQQGQAQQGSGGETDGKVQRRVEDLQGQIEELTRRVEEARAGAPTGTVGSFIMNDKVLGEKLKKLLTSVLFESGILEKFVGVTVDQKLRDLGVTGGSGGGTDVEGLKEESRRLVKDFLAQNLGTLFQSEIRGAVQKELQNYLASENMKMLIDDKFRAIQLYLTTEVIPTTVKQLLKKLSSQTA